MKRFHVALLAAAVSAGVPAMAFAQDAQQDRADRVGEHGMRPDGTRPSRRDTPQPQPQFQQPQAGQVRNPDFQRQQAPQQATQGQGDRGNFQGRGYGNGGRFAAGNPENRDRGQGFGDNRGGDNRGGPPPGARPVDRAGDRNGFGQGYPGRPGYDRANGNWQRPGGYGRPDGGGWRGPDWRQDRRYDWRGYRDQNRNLFRGPRYVAPRGWGYGYRRFDIGFRLPPYLFGQEYWIADPWVYRLPPVDGPYRWVRYFNDVLLIDLRTGEVVDEIPGFFF